MLNYDGYFLCVVESLYWLEQYVLSDRKYVDSMLCGMSKLRSGINVVPDFSGTFYLSP
jgi:hypothetical protein